MAALDLFPARVAFVDANGRLTPEAYRALNQLFSRQGASLGDLGTDTFGEVFGAFASENAQLAESVAQPAIELPLMAADVSQPTTDSYNAPEVFQPQDAKWLDAPLVRQNLTLPKTSGNGIKVDTDLPTFGWQDLLGRISIRGPGGTDPSFAVYRGTIRQFQFSVNDECWAEYHIPHDYLPGSDVFIHAHWSLATGGINETVTWGFDVSYAKGHNQAAFPATVTATVAQASSTTQYRHMLAEVQITGGGLLTAADIEPDGLIMVRAYLSANSGATEPFLHFCDLHYQTTNIGTKQKAPNFYV